MLPLHLGKLAFRNVLIDRTAQEINKSRPQNLVCWPKILESNREIDNGTVGLSFNSEMANTIILEITDDYDDISKLLHYDTIAH